MKKILSATIPLILTLALWDTVAHAASDASFPTGWETWPVLKEGAIPPKAEPVPADLPGIVQETFKTYNWVNDGKGSAYKVRLNPAHKAGEDGPAAVLELTDIKALLVTEHLLGEPLYGAWSYAGKDLADAHPSLAPKVCAACHSGYGEACVQGICNH